MRHSIIFVIGLIVCVLPCYPGKHQLMVERIKSLLLMEFGTKVTWTSIDTPELNAVSEREVSYS